MRRKIFIFFPFKKNEMAQGKGWYKGTGTGYLSLLKIKYTHFFIGEYGITNWYYREWWGDNDGGCSWGRWGSRDETLGSNRATDAEDGK